jgi:hypothetical protein
VSDPLTPDQLRARSEDRTAQLIAFILVCGFFGVILCALLGAVDITNPTVAGFVGTALGYVTGKLDGPIRRYFPINKSAE